MYALGIQISYVGWGSVDLLTEPEEPDLVFIGEPCKEFEVLMTILQYSAKLCNSI